MTCANLEVSRPGASRAGEILLLGAHYDSVRDCPGANDNGSGVAALLEIARRFAALTPALTVRFVAFVNEEPPFFMTRRQGSAVYAKAARARGDDIRLMVSLETLGYYSDAPGSQRYPPLFRFFYPDRGNFLGLVSDLRSRRRDATGREGLSRAAPISRCSTRRPCAGSPASPGATICRSGARAIAALMATDTAFYRYRYYHTAQDTPDKLAYPAFGRATEALGTCFAALAEQGLG